jgi:hypothetical protein
MFAHAMSRTMPTTVIRIREICTTGAPAWPLGFSRASSSGTAPALRPRFSVGKACSSPANTVWRLALACATSTPGLSRPNAKRNSPRRCSYQSNPGWATPCIDIGTQIDGPPPSRVPVKPRGAMPTTVNGCRLRVSVRPTTAGSLPRLRSQNPWLTTATGVADRSSSGRKARPAVIRTPSTEK